MNVLCLYLVMFTLLLMADGRPQIPEGLGDTISSIGGTAADLIRYTVYMADLILVIKRNIITMDRNLRLHNYFFTYVQIIRNGDPAKILKGTSALIDGLGGGGSNNSTNSTGGIAEVATDVLVGTTRVGGDILESQPAIAETGKGVAADVVSIGSKIVGEVSKNDQIVEGAIEVGKTIQNVFQGLFG